MDADARKAHLVLIGQPLLDEWLVFCAAWHHSRWGHSMSTKDNGITAWDTAIRDWYGPHVDYNWVAPAGRATLDDCQISGGDYYTYQAPTT